jgi:membrane-associated phospholipid phosphatase
MNRPINTVCVSTALVVTTWLSGQPALAQLPLPASSATDIASRSTFTPSPIGTDLFKNTINDFRNLASLDGVTLIAIGAVAAGLSTPIDSHVSSQMAGTTVARSFRTGNTLGTGKVQFASALATYAIGRVTNNPRVIDVGSKLFRAQFVAHAVTTTLKHTVNRTRPDGSDSFSFPSGHTCFNASSAGRSAFRRTPSPRPSGPLASRRRNTI